MLSTKLWPPSSARVLTKIQIAPFVFVRVEQTKFAELSLKVQNLVTEQKELEKRAVDNGDVLKMRGDAIINFYRNMLQTMQQENQYSNASAASYRHG